MLDITFAWLLIIIASSRMSFSQINNMQLDIEPSTTRLYHYRRQSERVNLRCYLSPNQSNRVYLVWRFRPSSNPQDPPLNWGVVHRQDDIVRCPNPPHFCNFVNSLAKAVANDSEFAQINFQVGMRDGGSAVNESDRQLIANKQLHLLRLNRPVEWLDGIYQCYAIINLEVVEQRKSLQVLSVPLSKPSIIGIYKRCPGRRRRTNSNISSPDSLLSASLLNAYTSYCFICSIAGSNPKPQIKWRLTFHDQSIDWLTGDEHLDGSNSSWRPYTSWESHFTSKDLDHRADGARLQCLAENSVGLVESEYLTLSVRHAPVFNSMPKQLNLVQDESSSQLCSFQANPLAKGYWVNSAGTVISNTSLLRINSTTVPTSNTFNCIATNLVGSTEFNLDVNVLYPPKVRIPSSVIARQGERLEVACFAESNPPIERIYWTFDGPSLLHRGRSRSLVVSNSASLVIDQVGEEDAGTYTCHAQAGPIEAIANRSLLQWWAEVAESVAVMRISVESGLSNLKMTVNPRGQILAGQRVHLNCSDDSTSHSNRHRTDFKWTLSTLRDLLPTRLGPFTNASYSIDDHKGSWSQLTLYNASLLDSGTFTCIKIDQTNSYRPVSILISVKGRPLLLPRYNNVSFSASENHFELVPTESSTHLVIECSFLTDHPSIVTWGWRSRRDDARQRYNLPTDWNQQQEIENYPTGISLVESKLILPHPNIVSDTIVHQFDVELAYIDFLRGIFDWQARDRLGVEGRKFKLRLSNLKPILLTSPDNGVLAVERQLEAVKKRAMQGPFICHFAAPEPSMIDHLTWSRRLNKGLPTSTKHDWHEVVSVVPPKERHLTQIIDDKWELHVVWMNTTINWLPTARSPSQLAVSPRSSYRQTLPSNHNTSDQLDQLMSFLDSVFNHLPSKITSTSLLTALWLLNSNSETDLGDTYRCSSSNQAGSSGQILRLVEAGAPGPPKEISIVKVSWMSVLIQWSPVFHGLPLHQLLSGNQEVLTSRADLQATYSRLLSAWIRVSRSQLVSCTIHLTDESVKRSNQKNIASTIISSTTRSIEVYQKLQYNVTTIHLPTPNNIEINYREYYVQIPPGNPAICLLIQLDQSNRPNPVKVKNEPILLPEQGHLLAPNTISQSISNCYQLQWNASFNLSLVGLDDRLIRLAYCDMGNRNRCSSFHEPVDYDPQSAKALFKVGLACLAAIAVLSGILVMILCWSRRRRRRRRSEAENCNDHVSSMRFWHSRSPGVGEDGVNK